MKTFIVVHYRKDRRRDTVYVINAESANDAEESAGKNTSHGKVVTYEVPMDKKGVIEKVWIPDLSSAQLE